MSTSARYRPKPPRGTGTGDFTWVRRILLAAGCGSLYTAAFMGYTAFDSRNLAVISPAGYIAQWSWVYASIAFIFIGVTIGIFALAALPILGNIIANNRRGRPIDVIRAVQEECEERNYNYLKAAFDLFEMRKEQYKRPAANRAFQHGKSYFESNWVLMSVKMIRENFRQCSATFISRLQRDVSEKRSVVNAYYNAAKEDMSASLKRYVRRGLSAPFRPGSDEEENRFVENIATRLEASNPIHDDVLVVCISYRHQEGESKWMGPQDWRIVYRDVSQFANNVGASSFQVWVDKNAINDGYDWIQTGLWPYLMFPTYIANVPGVRDNRLWIRLEELCATLGPGIISRGMSENDYISKLASTWTPLEAALAVAELLCSNYSLELEVTWEKDKVALKQWAKGVLSCDDVEDILDTPNRDLGWGRTAQKDLSHLTLFDTDLNDVSIVKGYKRHLCIARDGANGCWDPAAVLSCGEIRSEYVGQAREIMNEAYVTYVTKHATLDSENQLIRYLVIVPTISGTVVMTVDVDNCEHGRLKGNVKKIMYDETVSDEVVMKLMSGKARSKKGVRPHRTAVLIDST